MDYEDAVEELAAVLKDSDYNLLLMYELANCLSHAGANEEAEQMYGYADEKPSAPRPVHCFAPD
jgi:formylmethanofuran dehydrogenase subunit B